MTTCPSDDTLHLAIPPLRASHPTLGAAKLLAQLKLEHPEWTISEKRFRKLLTPTADAGNLEHDLIATTTLDPTLNLDALAPKAKVKMFPSGKGKGLVARTKILQGEVLWQEDPWIITSDPSLHAPLASREMCSQCFSLFSQPSPPLSVSCPHCDTAHFCNRLCLSRNKTAHPSLLCPGLNPGAIPLLDLAKHSRHLTAVAKIIALWRSEREYGDPNATTQRVWSMARVSEEERESEKREWEFIGENRRKDWHHAHATLLAALNPSTTDPHYTSFQKLLSRPTPLTPTETSQWFSYDSYLQLLGLAALNQEDSGGLYPLHAHMNHSCEPNISARNLPKSYIPTPHLPPPREVGARTTNRLTILARRTIHPGEELTLSYANPQMPRSHRRRYLRENYGFWCACPKCIREKDQPEDQAGKLAQAKDIQQPRAMGQRGLDGSGTSTLNEDHVHGHGCKHSS